MDRDPPERSTIKDNWMSTMATIINDENTENDIGDTTVSHFLNESSRHAELCRQHLPALKARRVVEFASKTIQELSLSEEFRKQQSVSSHPPLNVHHTDFELGDLLGQGTFSDVFAIRTSSMKSIDPQKYVVKILREKMLCEPALFASSAAGLVTEATILSLLDHKNIISVKAWSSRGVGGYSNGMNDSFFLVLDRLDIMLSSRIQEWKHKVDACTIFCRHRHEKLDCLLSERLRVAVDIAGAVAYLHTRRIVHRDLKPSNIGFQNDVPKLFDFDVSRFLPKQVEEGQIFNMTAMTGTRRYMSPENGLFEPYNEKTDVYSFAILLNEMVSLQKAFMGLTKREHETKVFRGGMRPHVSLACSKRLRQMIEQAWDRDMEIRPSMAVIHKILTEEQLKIPSIPVASNPPSRHWFSALKINRILPPASALDLQPMQT
mmetsp:Transcript_25698/g.73943  ORF Transcript_25698/g.73943 Transcript_25698/m.73943 type:complete len:433 (-) Transcript_25698:38-1336(-)